MSNGYKFIGNELFISVTNIRQLLDKFNSELLPGVRHPNVQVAMATVQAVSEMFLELEVETLRKKVSDG